MRRTPPLNALRAFEAAVRNASLTRAAQELRVTQSAVSRHVSGLEKWLGAVLVHRTRRGIEVTAAGTELFTAVQKAFDEIEGVARRLQQNQGLSTLRLKLPPTFAIRWMVPRLARFLAVNKRINIQITTSHHQVVDLEREDIDFSIHYAATPLSMARCRRLFGEILLPVCSPNLLQREPILSRPADLSRQVLLCSLNRPWDWPMWLAAAGHTEIDGNSGLRFESSALACQAAVDGLGVAIAQRAFVSDDLKSGRLVAPFTLGVPTDSFYYLARSTARPWSRDAEAFEGWIREEARLMEDASLD
jgi:LysR family transcriptional regulator, glycine cleavage system transcriptional activator